MSNQANTMDKILAILGIAVAVFTVVMILLYIFTGGIPETLCQCFYSICGGECGMMAIIKSFKVMAVNRAWAVEDRKRNEKVKTEGKNFTFDGDNSNYSSDYCEENENIVE